MTIASKTVVLQMRFTGRGAPFGDVAAKSSIDTSGISAFTDAGRAFFGVSNEITAPTYPSYKNPIRNGAPFKWVTTKSTIDAHYGKIEAGAPFYVAFAGTSSYISTRKPTRNGAPWLDTTTKSTIDAQDMKFVDAAHPFWVKYTGSAPVFDATRFFIFFG